MPVRLFSRKQTWLLPPTLEEMVPAEHPARFVAVLVDELDRAAWMEMGIKPEGEAVGAPEYHPRVLLGVWLYGFMTGVRSARKLEAACRDQLPYRWLTGWQVPDHNTLWRFYRENRDQMRKLLKRTVKTAVDMGLVDLALQAVDGTKIAGNASRFRSYNEAGLRRLLEGTEAAIKDLEAQNTTGGEATPPRLPEELAKAEVLREQVLEALKRVQAEEGQRYVNLTDGDAALMKGRDGVVAGYNAQAMVSPLKSEVAGRGGMLITAAEVTADAVDQAQLVPMLEAAEGNTGQAAGVTLADAGYHSGLNLEACEKRGDKVLMPEAQERALKSPYHKDHFEYDAESDSYVCPRGERLEFKGTKQRSGEPEVRVYRGEAARCRACPAFGECTKNKRHGRELEIGPYEGALQRHRALMATEEAKASYRRRKGLPEPVFGILKELHGARRFLLRGLVNVQAEWVLLATAFNLRTLWGIWRSWLAREQRMLTALS